ncbi:MAG: hypothetical protein D6742_15580 [Cyanobacteria bacterium J069]|nr:MAG: hypothetical protein D6742_15580 [Cyanobacteria bacterium J069]
MMKKYKRVIKPEHNISQKFKWRSPWLAPDRLAVCAQTRTPLADSPQFSNAADSEMSVMVVELPLLQLCQWWAIALARRAIALGLAPTRQTPV